MRPGRPCRPWASWVGARRVRMASGDRGASLILALVIITVISVAIAGVLTVAFANVRATTALREQAAAHPSFAKVLENWLAFRDGQILWSSVNDGAAERFLASTRQSGLK